MNALRRAFLNEFHDFRVDVPEGVSGLWQVRRRAMTKRDAQVANIVDSVLRTDRVAFPGTYTQLGRFGDLGNPYEVEIVMSDHQCEVADHAALVDYARARLHLKHVLVNGLGLGVAIALLAPYVDHFTIVELSANVITLVAPHYQARYPGRIDIIQHDALTYRPPKGTRYDAVFHDIWSTISHNNLAEMRHLERRYGHSCDWQESWARVYCERQARKRKRHPEQYENEVSMNELYEAVNVILNPA